MKRSVAIVLTIAIFAAVAVFFLRPGDPNPDFGYADRVYTAFAQPLELVEGDDVFELSYCGTSVGYINAGFSVRPNDGSRAYTLSGGMWMNSRYLSSSEDRDGYVTQQIDGEWVTIYDIGWVGSYPKAESHLIDGAVSKVGFHVPLPALADSSQVTLFYRDCDVDAEGGVTTCSELHSLTFQWEPLPRSNKPFDVVELSFFPNGNPDVLWLRANGNAALPYLDQASMCYEKLTDGKWVQCPSEYEYSSEATRYSMGARLEYAHERLTDTAGYRVWAGSLEPGDYRLTATFTENEDGSGEQYTLTLRLRFDE